MPEWRTYTLSDFLLFSPRTYFRMLELYNRQIWPAQIAAVAAGLLVARLARSPRGGRRIVPALLAVCWLWIGVGFEAAHYASINWAARGLAWAFGLEAALLLAIGATGRRSGSAAARPAAGTLGFALFLFALLGYPLACRLSGRPWTQAEVFGTEPDPTALATIGLVPRERTSVYVSLALIPAISCVLSSLTLLAMRRPAEAVMPLIGAAAAAGRLCRPARIR